MIQNEILTIALIHAMIYTIMCNENISLCYKYTHALLPATSIHMQYFLIILQVYTCSTFPLCYKYTHAALPHYATSIHM